MTIKELEREFLASHFLGQDPHYMGNLIRIDLSAHHKKITKGQIVASIIVGDDIFF